jgi:mono/diheme cytochrome c family protein
MIGSHARLMALIVAATVPLVGQTGSRIKAGERLFALSCSVGYCHGVGGIAGHGPRLKDRQWDQGYLYKTIANGIPGTGMPAWKDKLTQPQISAVVSYIVSLSSNSEPAPLPAAAAQTAVPVNQAGQDLFFDPANDRNCGVCHRLRESGGSVGPALDNLAKKTQPDILSYLLKKLAAAGNPGLEIHAASGETICGIKVREDATHLQIYDLASSGPPVLRSFPVGEIVHRESCANLNVHTGLGALYTPSQIASIAGFIKSTEN